MFKPSRIMFLIATLLLVAACAPATSSRLSAPIVAPAPSLAATRTTGSDGLEFDAHKAYEQNQMLAVTIGTRVAGSDSGTRAGDYIAQQFSSFGLAIEQQAFTFQAWEDHGTTVKVTAPNSVVLDARPIQYSPAGNVQADLVAVRGNGVEGDFAAANVQGKIALVARGTIPFSDKSNNAAKAGAVGILIYNTDQGPFTGTLRDKAMIPTIGLSGKDGRALLDLLSTGQVQVRIDSNTVDLQKTGHNIIGTLKGSSEGVIVLGGHYDSVQAGPGAVDNGSGSAVLLELARELSQQNHKNTLVFIAFDGEEEGLLVSRHYVQQLSSADRAKIKGMLNFDMLGGGSGPLLAGGDGPLGAMSRDIAKQAGIDARDFALGGNSGSDHQPFQGAGIDTVFFSRDYTLLHTPQDVIGEVSEQYLGEAGRVGLRTAIMLDEKSTQ